MTRQEKKEIAKALQPFARLARLAELQGEYDSAMTVSNVEEFTAVTTFGDLRAIRKLHNRVCKPGQEE